MTAIKLDKFGGQLPAWNDRLLPDGQAAFSLNCYLFSGALIGWRQPKLLHALKNSASRYAYRIPSVATNNTVITAPDSFWMEFTDPDTTVMRSPVVQDSFNRHYWASPSNLPRYNTYDRILNGDPSWILGVPASGCAPGVTVDGGGDTIQVGDAVVLPNAVGAGADYRPGNEVFLMPIVPNGTLLIQDVSFVPASSDGALNFMAVVYSDLNGHPDRLIGVGDEVTGISAGATAVGTFTNAVSVISNTTYWIGIAHDNPFYLTVADTSVSTGASGSNTFSNGPPDPIAASLGHPVWQMWTDLIGASVFTARAYTYTWVTAYGEEGPPSVPSVVNGWSNATWTVSLFTPEPSDMGVDRNITKTRLYRSISNQSGQGTYFLVAEFPVTQATYVDTIDDATVALNAQLVSLYWFAPPTDLQGIVPFPNGIAVGWRSNEVWFSEAYRPHAWPPGYVLTTEFPIVGIGVCGQSIVVCTQSSPYLISGINPSAMALTKINLPEPCLHRGSIISTDTTVLYTSRNGLIQISQSGAGSNITEGWVTREKWQALTPQQHIRAIKLATNYMAFGTVSGGDNSVAQQGYTVELSTEDQTSFTVWPQPGGHRLGFGQLSAPNEVDIDNVLTDPWTGVGLLIQNSGVYYWDFSDQEPVIVPYRWKSKTYQFQSRKNLSAMKVWFNVPPGTPAQGDRNTAEPQPVLSDNQYGILRIFADDQLYQTRELRSSGELLRIQSSSKYESWAFEIEGRVSVSNVQVASSVKELGLV
jgi:hypothetical protein